MTIAAYNGIQQRASNTQTIDATSKYIRILRLYSQQYGDYPRTADAASNTNACLGKTYAGSICANIGGAGVVCGTGQANRSAAFETKLSEFISSFPEPSLQTITWCNQPFAGIGYWYGAGSYSPSVHYYLMGDVACPTFSNGSGGKSLQSGNTKCWWNLTPA